MRALREIRDGGGGGGARDAGNEDAVFVIVIRARDAGSEMRFVSATRARRGVRPRWRASSAATVSSGPLVLRRVAAEHASLVARYTNARTVVRASNPTAAHAAPNTHACCGASLGFPRE